ncbi:D-glycero-beta-D-manno-heptose 1,7-bisphosphate 7-phosphatase [Aquabacterium sp. A7-Y]|uniref:D-glycero-beta-D-manno-heptose 1,7-bisphosphate 7-phosphatase n=1 Tax=Aquabacterium sp. A7-Y TaxID=1349605 RepID=UPI00223D01ED|nr:D-glycero-beta-D-manno-heptose 1,7-bisphosphate 7-phosphatase [Aquabacterium sp. A7-Y]MCW7537258.1 D-glycero-beta-D-manno-heptose 1,7-bisphosphate 7-phosphatase [Aquabacterium sp. A7-Y]
MKLVVLGRDGIVNRFREEHVASPAEWEPLPGALEAVARLNQAGWHVVLATNQPGLGTGLLDMASLNAVHHHMNEMLARHGARVDAIFICPHTAAEGCDCRKPAPGLLLKIGERFGVSLDQVAVAGDTVRDLQAARAAGCEPHLLRTGRSGYLSDEEARALAEQVPGSIVHDDLSAFAEYLVQRRQAARGERDPGGPSYGDILPSFR